MGLTALNKGCVYDAIDLENDVLRVDEVRFKELRVVGDDIVLLELLTHLEWRDNVVRIDSTSARP